MADDRPIQESSTGEGDHVMNQPDRNIALLVLRVENQHLRQDVIQLHQRIDFLGERIVAQRLEFDQILERSLRTLTMKNQRLRRENETLQSEIQLLRNNSTLSSGNSIDGTSQSKS